MPFFNDIDETKIKKKQIIDDWQELFPTFIKRKTGKRSIIFGLVNLPVIKNIYLDFDKLASYDVRADITSLFGGHCSCTRDYVEKKKHYLILSRGGEKYVNYRYAYKCIMEDCIAQGIDFYEPLSVSQVFNIYKLNSPYLSTDSADTPALVAAWAGMDNLAKEAADWAEEYYSQKVKRIEKSTWTLNAELLKLWNSLTDSERKNPHWADDLLSQQPNTGLVPPLVPVKNGHLLFRTPNGSSLYITLEDRTPMEQITRKPYKSVKDWREQLDARMADRDGLRKTVDENIKELGLEDAPRQELILE